MALPTKTKTWQFKVNQATKYQGTFAATFQAVMFALKQSLITFALQPWTVVGSSDGATAGLDAVDRWSAANKLVQAADASAHSWIVLKQTGVAANFQVCID